jgi:hypothetical protein
MQGYCLESLNTAFYRILLKIDTVSRSDNTFLICVNLRNLRIALSLELQCNALVELPAISYELISPPSIPAL